MTRKIGISISKGGVGKTTTSVNLSAGLAKLNYNVLLIDADTQGQSGETLGINPQYGLGDFLLEDCSFSDAVINARENLSLLAGGPGMAKARRRINSEDPLDIPRYLSKKLAPVDEDYDFVIIDTGPGWDEITLNIIFYVKEILSPVSMEVLTVHSLAEFQKRVEHLQTSGAPAKLEYILPTFLDKRVKKSDEIYQLLNTKFENKVCDPIRYNVKLSEAPAFNETIFEHDKNSTGAKDYAKLVKRILENGKS